MMGRKINPCLFLDLEPKIEAEKNALLFLLGNDEGQREYDRLVSESGGDDLALLDALSKKVAFTAETIPKYQKG